MIEEPYVGQKISLTDDAVKLYGKQFEDRVYTVSSRYIDPESGEVAVVCSELLSMNFLVSEIDAVTGNYPLVRLVKTDDGNLRINLRDRMSVDEIAHDEERGWNAKEREILEYQLCNGWTEIPAEITGLNSASWYSDSVEYANENDDTIARCDRMYSDFPYYQVRSWVQDLLRDGYAVLYGYPWEDDNAPTN